MGHCYVHFAFVFTLTCVTTHCVMTQITKRIITNYHASSLQFAGVQPIYTPATSVSQASRLPTQANGSHKATSAVLSSAHSALFESRPEIYEYREYDRQCISINCNILNWNVCGLTGKHRNGVLEKYIHPFDIICLSETKT